MPTQPNINRNALVAVKRATTGTIDLGKGAILTGAYSLDEFALAELPSTQDSIINGISYETAPDDINVGFILQAGLSNVKLRLGSAGVTMGDKLNIQDSTGVWQKAPSNALNVYYVALETAIAGAICWASPISSSVIPSSLPSRVFNNPNRTLNTAFQISATRDVQVSYSININVAALLIAGTSGTVFLEYADNAGMTTNLVIAAESTNSTGGVLSITNIGTGNVSAMIPAGKYVRLRTTNNSGTPTFAFMRGVETLL